MTEFTAYKAMNVGRGTDALNFWKQNHKAFPKLASIARRVLAVLAKLGGGGGWGYNPPRPPQTKKK